MFKVLVFVLAVTLGSTFAAPASISPALLLGSGTVDIIIKMEAKTLPALQQIQTRSFVNRAARLNQVAGSLKAISGASQAPILSFLAKTHPDLKVTSLWINNKISVKGADAALIRTLAAMEGVEAIIEDAIYTMPEEPAASPVAAKADPLELTWGVNMIDAPAVWARGFTGRGVRVGILDTGVRGTHQSLRANFAGTHGWLDAISGSPNPVDSAGHGTHCTGTIIGSDGIGVAPDAQWMGCRTSMAFTNVHYTELAACAQFFLCPTRPDGSNPDCTQAPHLVSNSWGYLYNMVEDFYDDVIPAWAAAGIIPIFAAGNEGPTCSRGRYPANSDLHLLITVGATDSSDRMAGFSSRGPSKSGNTVMPTISGPGVDVLSSYSTSDTAFASLSGTSMATPHVAGVVALLFSNGTDLTFNQVEQFLYRGVTRTVPATGANCGGVSETTFPNNVVGWGRLSASGAIARLLESRNEQF